MASQRHAVHSQHRASAHIFPCTKEEQLSKLGLGHGREHTNIWTDPKRAGSAGWLSSAVCLTSCGSGLHLFMFRAKGKVAQHLVSAVAML